MSPAQAPAESAEERILKAAAIDLRRVGARRLTVVAVAAAAGMTHANVYRFFTGKRDLLDAVLARWLRPLEARLAEIADAPDPADDKLERLLTQISRSYLEKLAEEPALFALLAEEGGSERFRHAERVKSLILRILEEGAATRVFPRGEAGRNLPLVLDLAHRFINAAALAAAAEDDRQLSARRDRTLRVVIRALGRGE